MRWVIVALALAACASDPAPVPAPPPAPPPAPVVKPPDPPAPAPAPAPRSVPELTALDRAENEIIRHCDRMDRDAAAQAFIADAASIFDLTEAIEDASERRERFCAHVRWVAAARHRQAAKEKGGR